MPPIGYEDCENYTAQTEPFPCKPRSLINEDDPEDYGKRYNQRSAHGSKRAEGPHFSRIVFFFFLFDDPAVCQPLFARILCRYGDIEYLFICRSHSSILPMGRLPFPVTETEI